MTLRKFSTSLITGFWSGSSANGTSLTLSSLGSSISSLRANSELNLAMTSSQNGVLYRRGFPKAQKLRPWLFIIMINELDVPATDLWKYVDDTTISKLNLPRRGITVTFCRIPKRKKFGMRSMKFVIATLLQKVSSALFLMEFSTLHLNLLLQQ